MDEGTNPAADTERVFDTSVLVVNCESCMAPKSVLDDPPRARLAGARADAGIGMSGGRRTQRACSRTVPSQRGIRTVARAIELGADGFVSVTPPGVTAPGSFRSAKTGGPWGRIASGLARSESLDRFDLMCPGRATKPSPRHGSPLAERT